jgi:hypothetical protein
MLKPAADPFDLLQQQRLTQPARERHLAHTARQFDRMIRRELQRLGVALWGVDHVLGVIPIHRYRVRFEPGVRICTWRVERDIPPYDCCCCAAYQVQLRLDDCDAPVITVRSQAATYRVAPPTSETLQAALVEAAQEAPLIILRDMGEASD